MTPAEAVASLLAEMRAAGGGPEADAYAGLSPAEVAQHALGTETNDERRAVWERVLLDSVRGLDVLEQPDVDADAMRATIATLAAEVTRLTRDRDLSKGAVDRWRETADGLRADRDRKRAETLAACERHRALVPIVDAAARLMREFAAGAVTGADLARLRDAGPAGWWVSVSEEGE
jgi:hypothetical protein